MYLQFEMDPRQMCVFSHLFRVGFDFVVVFVSFSFVAPTKPSAHIPRSPSDFVECR